MAMNQVDSCWACFGIPAGIPLPPMYYNTILFYCMSRDDHYGCVHSRSLACMQHSSVPALTAIHEK